MTPNRNNHKLQAPSSRRVDEAEGLSMENEAKGWKRLLELRQRREGAGLAAGPPIDMGGLEELYHPYCCIPQDRPFVVAHLGQSLDGRIATPAGASRWVTGEADLLHTHRMRALADAVIVGAGTVQHDDPQLTVRRCLGDNPTRVVIDAERRLDPHHRVFQDGAAPTLVLAAADRVRSGDRLGQAEFIAMPRTQGGIAPQAICDTLSARGLKFLFIEGGGITISRFVAAGKLDRLQLTVAPLLLGCGRPSLSLPEIVELGQGLRPRTRRYALDDDILYECIFRD
jgi:diaminohydroxyphosphoribosylaminopyrimidine deaminase / 5-amino-6-(5-phosphoribosylamino)uracil reductase